MDWQDEIEDVENEINDQLAIILATTQNAIEEIYSSSTSKDFKTIEIAIKKLSKATAKAIGLLRASHTFL